MTSKKDIFLLFFIFLFPFKVGFSKTSSSFQLRGTVPSKCAVEISTETISLNLDLINSGHSNIKVAEVSLETNSIRFISSLMIQGNTNGTLVNTSNPSFSIPYTLSYVSSDTGNTLDSFSLLPNLPISLDQIKKNKKFKGDLMINIIPDPNLPDGDYETSISVFCLLK